MSECKSSIDREVELNIWSLKRLAEQNNIELNYVLETYKNKVTHKISEYK